MEEEVLPLMIIGVCCVSMVELVYAVTFLKSRKKALKLCVGHIVSTLISFAFLLCAVFYSGPRIAPGMPDASHIRSAGMGMFGIFWFVSVALVISLIIELTDRKTTQDDAGTPGREQAC